MKKRTRASLIEGLESRLFLSGSTARLALISDFGTGLTSELDVANMVKGWNATSPLDAILTSGDNDQSNGDDYVNRVGNYYDEFINGRGSTTQRFLPVPGNHDWGYNTNRGTLTPYETFFTLPDASQGNTSGNERYYNYRIGPVEVFMLDSDTHEPDGTSSASAQANWLHDALTASTASWQIVSFHHAAYSSSSAHYSSTWMQWPFQDWGVDLVVNGHNHVYERVNPSGQPNGLRFVTNGMGGWDSFNGFGTTVSGSEKQYNAENGAILLEANATSLSYSFINTAGATIDTFSMTNLPLPNIAVSATNAAEGGSAGAFTFTRSNILTGDLTVNFTLSGTAANGTDYSLPLSVVVPAGATTFTLPLTAINDALAEGDETVILTLADDPAYVRRNTTATAIILDDDVLTATFQSGVDTNLLQNFPNTSYATSTFLTLDTDEPSGSSKWAQALIRFAGLDQIPVGSNILSATLQLNVIDAGSAVNVYRMTTPWTDASTWNSLGGGVQVGSETVSTADASFTPSATGLLTLDVTSGVQAWISNPSSSLGWLLNPTGGDGVDIDSFEGGVKPRLVINYAPAVPMPYINVSATDSAAAETGDAGAFTITRGSVLTGDVTVNYTMSGTAANGVDYVSLPGSVLIADGVTSVTIDVTPMNDRLGEGDETVILTVTPNAAYNVGIASAAIVLSDDDLRTATFGQGADTYIHSTNPDTSNATAEYLNVDTQDPPTTGGGIEQSLIRFSNLIGPAAGQIPAGSTILSATLSLNVNNTGNTVNVHRMTRSWTDASTWNSLGGGVQIGTETISSADATFTPSALGVHNLNVTASLAAWLADPSTEFGWVLNPTGTDGVDINSFENTSSKPRLVVNFAPPGAPPVAGDDEFTLEEDSSLDASPEGVLFNDTDPDDDPLTAVLLANAAHGVLALNADGTFTYQPAADFSGTDTFTYRAFDGASYSAPATVTLTVSPVNDAPVAVNDAFSGDEDALLSGNVLANDTDPDADPLRATLLSGPSRGALALSTDGFFTYTPPANVNGTDTFTYTVSDGPLTSSATVTLTITAVNDAPVAVADTASGTEDTPLTINVLANDTDADPTDKLSIKSFTNPANGTLTLNVDGSFTYTPNANFNGSDSFTYQAFDGLSYSQPATVTLTINAINDAPVAVNDAFSGPRNIPLSGNVLVNDSDPDGDRLMATLLSGPANGSLTLNADGSFTYTPNTDYQGPDSFTYIAKDAALDSASATVSLTVTRSNVVPNAASDAYTLSEDTPLTVTALGVLANDTDPDKDPLTAVVGSGPTNGSLALNADGTFTYAPNANFNGSDSFTYRAFDGLSYSQPAIVTLTIKPVNDAPVAVDDKADATEDVALTLAKADIAGNDIDVETPNAQLLITAVSGATNGTVTVNEDGTVTFIPALNFFGVAGFDYVISDGEFTDTGHVVIDVAAVNDAPVANDDAYTTDEDILLTVSGTGVLANDTDIDKNPLTAVVGSGPTNGSLTLNADGTFTYTPNANFNGTDSFTYTVTDGLAESNAATVRITIDPVNDAPVAVNDSATIIQGLTLNATVLANDTDVDSATLTAIIVPASGPSNGSLSLEADGKYTYTPNAGFTGTDSFTYVANDGSLNSAPATVTITVTPSMTDDFALSESTTYGTVTGGLSAVSASDDVYESLVEQRYGGNKKARLSHAWEFNVTGGPRVEFHVEAYHTSAAESFNFDYSLDGVAWAPMVTVTAAADTNTDQVFELPAATAGQVWVRAVDTNPATADSVADTLYVDRIFIRSILVVPPAAPTVTIEATDPSAAETTLEVEPNPAQFTVTRTGDRSASLLVSYTVEGSASAGDDYLALAGSVLIPAGAASASIDVAVLDDTLLEGAETLVVTLVDAAAYDLGDSVFATAAIADDEVATLVTISPVASTLAEGATQEFVVTRTGPTDAALVVSYSVAGTATAGADYQALTGAVTLLTGQQSATFSLVTINDTDYETDESIIISLSDGAAYDLGTPSTTTVTLTSEDVQTITVPAAPTNLTGRTINGGIIDLSWVDNADNETSYVVEWSQNGTSWAAYPELAENATTFRVTGLAKSTFYYFRVRAVNGAGSSDFSNVLKIRSAGK